MGAATIQALLIAGAEILKRASLSPRLDAEILLSAVSGKTRMQLITDSAECVSAEEESRYRVLLARRERREPIAYIIGEKEFYGLTFRVTPDVLIPRPETELMVERALAYLEAAGAIRMLDLGTGSGCIAIAVARSLREKKKTAQIVATDQSMAALKVAKDNAERLGVSDLIEFRSGDWFQCVRSDECFNVVVSNPPYISPGDSQVSPETNFEPATALYAPENGLQDIRQILRGISTLQRIPSLILIEFGASQAQLILELVGETGFSLLRKGAAVTILKDLAGLPRVLAIEKSANAECN